MLKALFAAFAALITTLSFASPAAAQFRSGDNALEVYRATLDSHPKFERSVSALCSPRGASITYRCPEGYQYLEPATIGRGNGRITNLPVGDGYRGRNYDPRGYGNYGGHPYYGGNYGVNVSAGIGVSLGGHYGYGNAYPYQTETSLGRTKKEKNPENRFQYCGEGIGWVRFGVSCTSQVRGAQALNEAPVLQHTALVAPVAIERTSAATRVFVANRFYNDRMYACYKTAGDEREQCDPI